MTRVIKYIVLLYHIVTTAVISEIRPVFNESKVRNHVTLFAAAAVEVRGRTRVEGGLTLQT
jgi:hypothetical protein